LFFAQKGTREGSASIVRNRPSLKKKIGGTPMSKHGTATAGQFMQLLAPLGKASATALAGFPISELMSALNSKGKKLTEYLRLVFTALLNDQLLCVQDPPSLRFKLRLGNFKTVLAMRRALDRAELKVVPWLEKMIKSKSFTVIGKPIELEFVALTAEDLGFENHVGFYEMCERAKQRGLSLCPPELAIQLYLNPIHNLLNSRYLIAMEPIEIEAYVKTRRHDTQRELCIFEFQSSTLRISNRVNYTDFSRLTKFIFMTSNAS
jgi:hypothetical protein